MKKLLYSLLIAFGAIALVACSDDEGTNPGNDGTPVVTIYQYAAPEGTNPDQTTAVRIVANDAVKEMYMLAQLKAEKDAYIEQNGLNAYCAYVCENGEAVTEENMDQVIENLMGLYAITVVATDNSGKMYAYEVTYKGLLWIPAGKTTIAQSFVHDGVAYLSGKVAVERQDDANVFRVVDLFHQLAPESCPAYGANSVLTFEFDADRNYVSFTTSQAPFVLCGFADGGKLMHGYWNPGSYAGYCYVEPYEDEDGGMWASTSMLKLDNNAGSLYTGGYIDFSVDDEELIWFE
ncbi:MAG: hypothetical protein IKM03_02720 [Alistipes sp.]|nr:hypothetical protein [Alistipes sp.]